MSRLIIVPQYPTALRYQEWWFEEFYNQFRKYFDEVVYLGTMRYGSELASRDHFAPIKAAIDYEASQIEHYMHINLEPSDILLLNDLSFPGLFANVLFHKTPPKCFAICHATSRNNYDYFSSDREYKWPIENAQAGLFNKIFVASEYHRQKLGWTHVEVVPFPNPPLEGMDLKRENFVVSVARKGNQKINACLEDKLKRAGIHILRANCTTWKEYYEFLAKSRILLITSKEETYGYQIVDAIKNGCVPLAPNKFSYPELLSKEYLYNDFEDLVFKLKAILEKWLLASVSAYKIKPKLLTEKKADNFYDTISEIMRNE